MRILATMTRGEETFPRLPIVPLIERYGLGEFDDVFDTRSILRMASAVCDLPTGHVLYLVDFASCRKPGMDEARLSRLDNEAHAEAAASDGFLLYFRGDADSDGHCRSFCVWRSRRAGSDAARKPKHRAAAAITAEAYDAYTVTMRELWLDRSSTGFGVGETRSYAIPALDA